MRRSSWIVSGMPGRAFETLRAALDHLAAPASKVRWLLRRHRARLRRRRTAAPGRR